MDNFIDFIISLRYVVLSTLITITLLVIFYYFKEKFINKNIWRQILTGIIFCVGLLIIIYSVYNGDNTYNFYDTSGVYITFLAVNYQPVAVITMMILTQLGFTIYLEGKLLLIFTISILLPVIAVYGYQLLFKKRLKEFTFFENNLFLFTINLILILFIHLTIGASIYMVIVLLLICPLIYSSIIAVNKNLNNYYLLIKLYNDKNKIITKSLNSTKEFEIYILDANYNYLYFNQYHYDAMNFFNNSEPNIGDNFLSNVSNEAIRRRLKINIDLALSGQRTVEKILIEDGNQNYLEEHFIPVYDEKGNVIYVSVFSHNINEQVNYEMQIDFLSNYDGLTKLLNRRSLIKNKQKFEDNDSLTIAFFDVNNLKFINDVFGHLKGDELLNIVANELKETYNSFANIYRIGGDEFIVVYSDNSKDHFKEAIGVKDRLGKIKINEIPIKISMGLADRKQNETFDQLLGIAEGIMYEQKIYYSSIELIDNIEIIHNSLLTKKIISQESIDHLSELAKVFIEPLEMTKEDYEILRKFIKYHNIGLISSLESGQDEGYKYIEVGYRILVSTKDYSIFSNDIINQYENYDGTGQPQGLLGENISIRAKILRIIKAYDKLVNQEFFSKEEAILKLKNDKGKIFDPFLLDIFIENL